MGFLDWLKATWFDITNYSRVRDQIVNASSVEEINRVWNSLPERDKTIFGMQSVYEGQKKSQAAWDFASGDPVKSLISAGLDEWLQVIKKYDNADPDKAKENLKQLTADVMKISTAIAASEVALTKLPWFDGEVIAGMSRRTAAWLGFGAVMNAAAHDPVKIGILRPYQDALEATFRNKRPDHVSVMQSYTQRSLSPTRIEDPDKITEALMTKVENENDKRFDEEMAKHGFSQWFIDVLKDTSTKTLTFSNLAQLAKMGHYNRGLATYSLWGMGLDRRLMKAALDTLDKMNEVSQFEGFRSMIEPSYVEGEITEADIKEYYNAIRVPPKVQEWILPRLTKKRDALKLKAETGAPAKEKDLTVSQIQQAYQNDLIERGPAQNHIISIGYSLDEAKILLDLADLRRKLPGAQNLKRLTLTDYEKAFKNNLLTLEEVLDRMRGEYTPEDIELEKGLLMIGKA